MGSAYAEYSMHTEDAMHTEHALEKAFFSYGSATEKNANLKNRIILP